MPGPHLHREHADRPAGRHPPHGIGHVDAGSLLAHDDRPDVGLGRSLDDVVDRIADQELDALALENLGDGGRTFTTGLPSLRLPRSAPGRRSEGFALAAGCVRISGGNGGASEQGRTRGSRVDRQRPVPMASATGTLAGAVQGAIRGQPEPRRAGRAVGRPKDEIDTPALLLDLDRFERNATKISTFLRAHGVGWRPALQGPQVAGDRPPADAARRHRDHLRQVVRSARSWSTRHPEHPRWPTSRVAARSSTASRRSIGAPRSSPAPTARRT